MRGGDIMNVFYVYEWYIVGTNEVFYVGKGKNDRYKATGHKNKKFWEIYNSNTCDVRFVKTNLTELEAFNLEIELIKFYRENTNYRLTNIANGGQGSSGYTVTDEMKEHLRCTSKKIWDNPDFKKKMMNLRSDINGPYKSEEFRKKISLLVSGSKNPNYKNYWSLEQKNKLREQRKNDIRYKLDNNPNATPVMCLETGEIFSCIKFAQEKYNIKTNGSISVALKHPQKTAGGMHWIKYKGEPLSDDKRFWTLLNSLSKNENKKSIICCETKEIYQSKSELYDKFYDKVSIRKINHGLLHKNLVIDGNTYMYISDFIKSHQAEMSVENPE